MSHRAKTTASEAGVILGLSKCEETGFMFLLSRYALPRSLYEVKTGMVTRSKENTVATNHGKSTEAAIRDLYSELLDCVVELAPFRNHWSPEWTEKMGAEPDGIIPGPSPKEARLLEIKCPFYDLNWEFIPPDYIAQIQFQMEVWDVGSCDLVVFFQGSERLKIWRIFRCSAFIRWMQERLEIFISKVETRETLTSADIPHIYYDAVSLMEKEFRFSEIKTKFTRKQLPPRVFSQIIKDQQITPNQLHDIHRKQKGHQPLIPKWLMRRLTDLALLVIFVLVFLSLIPVVR